MSIPKKPIEGANYASEEQKHPEASGGGGIAIRNPRIQTAIHLMNSNLDRPISLAEMATAAPFLLLISRICSRLKPDSRRGNI